MKPKLHKEDISRQTPLVGLEPSTTGKPVGCSTTCAISKALFGSSLPMATEKGEQLNNATRG